VGSFKVYISPPLLCGKRFIRKYELQGVRHASGDEVSPLWESAVWAPFPGGGSGSDLLSPNWQPKRECPTGICPKVWAALFGLPRILADAELFWPEIQRQRLSTHE
jgi:hypothetical protein